MKSSRSALAERVSGNVRVSLAAAAWVLLHIYAGRPLLVAAHAGGVAPLVAWSGLLLAASLPLGLLFSGRADSVGLRSLAHWIGYATMGVFSLLLFFVAGGDLLHLAWNAERLIAAASPHIVEWPAFDARLLDFAILASVAALSAVGLLQARRPSIRNVSIPIDDLPQDLIGFRMVQLSDIHVGPTIRRRFVESLVERVNELDADAVAVTGDLVDGRVEDLREHIAPLSGLRARHGTFVVTGNHEYYWRAEEWVREYQRLGMIFLQNDHRLIAHGSAIVAVAGVTDPAGRQSHAPDPVAALEGASHADCRILLSHRPQTAEAANELGVELQLSGHTHGGQFFPFNFFIKWFQPMVAGLHRVGRTWLYVSRGTGYWGPPSRLGVGGEITVVELVRA